MKWPTQSDVPAFFGPPAEQQVMLNTPYPLRLAWDVGVVVNRFQCHRLVHDAFHAVFEETLREYGLPKIQELGLDLFGGCFNHRPMRGGTQLSMHSWGIAIDLDPSNNQLNWNRSRARFAQEEYEPFWLIVESQGLISLGRERDFDWMHFQAARLGAVASTSGSNIAAVPPTVLRIGSRGAEVAQMQAALGVPADGIFGPITESAVRQFQDRSGLVADGLFGPRTRGALFPV